MELIILAGGLGTRLKSSLPDLPKCMAPVAGIPFLDHLIGYFLDSGIHKFVFALGHMHQIVLDHLNTRWPDLKYEYSIEVEALGTGGAIKLAMNKIQGENNMVINGDTIFFIDFNKLLKTHLKNDALITLSLKNLANFDRYGTVEIDQNLKIAGFNEKRKCVQGLINGGVYMINKEKFEQLNLPEKFSLEKEVLENKEMIGQLYAEVYEDYFIDIGIPEDFLKANIDLA